MTKSLLIRVARAAAVAAYLTASLTASLAASAVVAAPREDPRAFVSRLYAHYPQRAGGPVFDPAGRSAAVVFDRSLIALLDEDSRLTPKGDIGTIEGDPLCDCQDDAGLTATIKTVRLKDQGHAVALVILRFAAGADVRRLTLDLVAAGEGWRVHDIHTKDTPSLRDLLTRAISAQRKAR